MTFQPTPNEESVARSLAEEAISTSNLKTDERLYYVNSELYREKNDEGKGGAARLVMLTHYRYDGDVTIKTLVSIGEKKVVKVTPIPHIPTPLSQEEFKIAKSLAAAELEIKRVIATYPRLVFEPLVVRSLSEQERPQRLVRLLLKVGSDYLRQPIVYVDLITKKVVIESPTQPSVTTH
jgi:hypothetical protein